MSVADPTLIVNPDRTVTDIASDYVMEGCECDNTHQNHDTVCRFCYAHGRRRWNDLEVQDAYPAIRDTGESVGLA